MTRYQVRVNDQRIPIYFVVDTITQEIMTDKVGREEFIFEQKAYDLADELERG